MYKLKCLQGSALKEDALFETKKDVLDNLVNFHNQDFTGTDDKDNELSIENYFKFWEINTEE
jgi:hypothetical protein